MWRANKDDAGDLVDKIFVTEKLLVSNAKRLLKDDTTQTMADQ